jgi:hypothetical protein
MKETIKMTVQIAQERIAQIDRMLENACVWGSWMVMCANEREDLVNYLCREGVATEHKWLARTGDGQRTD